jgi:Undecaprenyl-phosphate galactose phosphotransferase WbaP
LKIRYPLMNRWSQLLKRCIDIALSVLGLVVLAPILALITLVVKLGSPGPVFYRQKRLGKHGMPFEMLKFRTMYVNADQMLVQYLAQNSELRAEWDCYQKLARDPRITPLGTFLRRFSLDELPQLWNVLVGQMSLVGPRPIMLGQREIYGDNFKHYVRTQPGITGLWQISGRNHASYEERTEFDVHYVNNWSVWLDIYILVRTIWVVLRADGAC